MVHYVGHTKRLDLRPIFLITGSLLSIVALTMFIITVISLVFDDGEYYAFVTSAVLTLFVGFSIVLANWIGAFRLSLREIFLLGTVTWITVPAFSALPFIFSSLQMNYTDAFFEAMSGLTTTGSTVIIGLETTAPSLLLWRATLQWFGGISTVLTALLVFPVLGVGGMQIFRVEAINSYGRLVPKSVSLSASIISLYAFLTIFCSLALWILGMNSFNAITYAMSALSTGGFSTSDLSIAYFNLPRIEIAVAIVMIIGSLPFMLYFHIVCGTRSFIFKDKQIYTFLSILGISMLLVFIWLWIIADRPLLHAIRVAIFMTTSMITGTGYFLGDYLQWGGLPTIIFFFLGFVGGCVGSTACAIKVFRFQILYAVAKVQMAKLLQPHGVFIPYYNYRPIPYGVPEAIIVFFSLRFYTSYCNYNT